MDFRFARISDPQAFVALLTDIDIELKPKTQKKKPKKAVKTSEYINVGGVYFIMSDWSLFSKHYFEKLIPTGDVIAQYLGQRVAVTHIHEELVRVCFLDTEHLADGWVPHQVLKSSRPKSIILELKSDVKTSKSGKKHHSKELLSKVDSLTSSNGDLQKKNEVLSSENLQQDAEITRLQAECTRIQKESEIMAENFAGERVRLKEQLDKDRDEMYLSISRLKAMEETHVEKKISNLPLIFESASMSELFEASATLQKHIMEATNRLQEEKRMAEIARTRAEDQHLCVVCKTEPITHQFRPCNHFCVCEHCAGKVRSNSNQCPMCRKYIRSIERTFAV